MNKTMKAAVVRAFGKPLRNALSGVHSARLGTQWRVLYRIDESKHAVKLASGPLCYWQVGNAA